MTRDAPAPRFSLPLTGPQDAIWRAQSPDRSDPLLNAAQYLEYLGPVDPDALARAVGRTIADAPAVSLRFVEAEGGAHQVPGLPPMLCYADLCSQPDSMGQALALMRADYSRPLRLADEPAGAFTLFMIGPHRHLLYQRIHRLAADRDGMMLLMNQIAAHYAALTAGGPVPAPFAPLSAVVKEDARYRASSQAAADRAWWQAELADLPEAAISWPGRAVPGDGFHRQGLALEPQLLTSLIENAARHQLSCSDLLTALAGAGLAEATGAEVIGVPFHVRGTKAIRVPCMATTILPIRLPRQQSIPLSEWMAQLSARMTLARRHGRYPVANLMPDDTRSPFHPIVDVQQGGASPAFPGLQTSLHTLSAGMAEDLIVTFRGDHGTDIQLEIQARGELYTADETAALAMRLRGFLATTLKQCGPSAA